MQVFVTYYKPLNTKDRFEQIFCTASVNTCRETITRKKEDTQLQFKNPVQINFNKTLNDFNYTQFKIPKRSGGYRTIDAPNPKLKEEQYKFLKYFEHTNSAVHNNAYAYVKGRECLNALQLHQKNGSRWFLKLDLKSFFPSCTADFVVHQLKQLFPLNNPEVFTPEIEEWFRQVCFKEGVLPQGAPTSPKLCNLIMIPFDHAIVAQLHKIDHNFIYTRYADDILISNKYDFNYTEIVKVLENIFKDTPLTINKAKTRYGSNAGRNWNLGLMTNKDNNITVGHRRKRQLKIALHNFMSDYTNNIPWELADLYHLQGELSYIKHIEPEFIQNLLDNKYPALYNNMRLAIKDFHL